MTPLLPPMKTKSLSEQDYYALGQRGHRSTFWGLVRRVRRFLRLRRERPGQATHRSVTLGVPRLLSHRRL